jgi:hypothetical protein
VTTRYTRGRTCIWLGESEGQRRGWRDRRRDSEELVGQELRSHTYRPQSVRQVMIPKPGKPGELRPPVLDRFPCRPLSSLDLPEVSETRLSSDACYESWYSRPHNCSGLAAGLTMLLCDGQPLSRTNKRPINGVEPAGSAPVE